MTAVSPVSFTLRDLRYRLVEAPDSVGAHARARRWQRLIDWFPDFTDMRVVDLGGRVDTWLQAPFRPYGLHVINPEEDRRSDAPDWIEVTACDACALPGNISNRRYDLVFSNAVLEHVGGHERRRRFADSVHTLADRHWVQTPYRYFPLEPHWLFPGMQFLPLAARYQVAWRWPLAHQPARNRDRTLRAVLGTELVARTEMRHLFADSEIAAERMCGLVKSLIAIRSAN